MSSENVRRHYLRFLGGLYELASQFEPRELDAIRGAALREGQRAVASIAESLGRLANDSKNPRPPDNDSNGTTLDPVQKELALREVLLSKELFANNDAVATALAPHLKINVRPKESRKRLINRISAELRTMNPDQRRTVEAAIQAIITRHGNSDFVSRWSRIIRSL